MAERRRLIVSALGDSALVRFVDKKIVDSANIEEMGDEMFTLIEKDNFKNVVLNFEGVDFLSSAALNKIIMMDKKVKKVSGKFSLCCLKKEIMEVFTLTRLNKIVDIRKTEPEALKAIGLG